MSKQHEPMTKFNDECICGNVWPCPVDLERQLAEAKTILSDLPDHSDVDAAVFEANALRGQLAEAQGKLAAVDKELHTVSCRSKKTCEHAVCGLARRVARILKGDA